MLLLDATRLAHPPPFQVYLLASLPGSAQLKKEEEEDGEEEEEEEEVEAKFPHRNQISGRAQFPCCIMMMMALDGLSKIRP